MINRLFQYLTHLYFSQFRMTWISRHFSCIPNLGVSKTNSFPGIILKFGTQTQHLLGYPQLLKKWHNLHIDFTLIRVFERLPFYYLMINIGYNEHKSIFHHTILVSQAHYYLKNNIKRIVIPCW